MDGQNGKKESSELTDSNSQSQTIPRMPGSTQVQKPVDESGRKRQAQSESNSISGLEEQDPTPITIKKGKESPAAKNRRENSPELSDLEEGEFVEEECWDEIGPLELINLRYGSRSWWDGLIFEIVNPESLELFKKREEGNIVRIHKVVKNKATGKYVDDLENPLPVDVIGRVDSVSVHRIDEKKCVLSLTEPLFTIESPMLRCKTFRFEKIDMPEGKSFSLISMPQSLHFLHLHVQDSATIALHQDFPVNPENFSLSQQHGLQMALNPKRKLVCLEGNINTGKSTVLAHVLFHQLKADKSVLVLTPTKTSLEGLYEKLEEVRKANNLEVHKDAIVDFHTLRRYYKGLDGVQVELSKVRIVFCVIEDKFLKMIESWKTFIPEMCMFDDAGQIFRSHWKKMNRGERIVMAGTFTELTRNLERRDESRKDQKSVMKLIEENQKFFSYSKIDYGNLKNIGS